MEKKISRIRFLLHNRTFLKTLFSHFRKKPSLDGVEKDDFESKKIFNYHLNFENPRTFNEKIIWLKHHYYNEKWCECADKLGSKKFLTEKGFSKYLPKTYGVYDNSKQINLEKLPQKFVLKTNHDCGTVFVCDKTKTNLKEKFEKLDNSLMSDYSCRNSNSEWVYNKIKPVIFSEEVLTDYYGGNIIDYKFFIFNGKCCFGFLGQNRNVDVRFAVFDRNFNFFNTEYIHLKPSKKDIIKKPNCWDEMVRVAEKIGSYLDFVRVDLYLTTDGIKIGELTFFSHSGLGSFTKSKYDFLFGKFFDNTKFKDLFGKQDLFPNGVFIEGETKL